MKRILMVGLTPPLEGGSERVIYELSSRIGKCDVFTERGSICRNKIDFPVVKSPSLLRNILFALWFRIYVIFLLLTPIRRYDLIHLHENLLYPCAIPLSWRYEVVVAVHGMKGFKFYDNRLLWLIFKQGLRFADKIIAVSKSDKKLLDKEFANVVYIPNGVDLSSYTKTNPKVGKKVVFIGRVHEQKGIIYLLKAFNIVLNRHPEYNLEIIGEINDYARELQNKFPDRRIIWRGFIRDRTEIARSLKAAKCIVLPSLWEGLPLTLFESLASSRPLIVSDISAFRDVVREEVLFFKSKNYEDLAKKIKFLIEDKKKAEKLGKLGEKLSKKYKWEEIAEETRRIYEL